MRPITLSAPEALTLLALRLSGVSSVIALRHIGKPLVYSVPAGYWWRDLRWRTTNVTLPYVSVLKSESIEPVGFNPKPPIKRKRLSRRKQFTVGSKWQFTVGERTSKQRRT
jgi:hypothetical protein